MSGSARYHESKSRCCLCNSLGENEKLFNGCQHESACRKCLRDRYISPMAMHQYPLQCFGCQRVLQDAQIKRITVCKNELRIFRYFNNFVKSNKAIANLNRKRFGEDWKGLLEVAKALDGLEIGRCPSCRMFIIKNGGCNHMDCYCGASFYWKQDARQKDHQSLVLPILPKIHHVTNLPPLAAKIDPAPPVRLGDDQEDVTVSVYSDFSDDEEEEDIMEAVSTSDDDASTCEDPRDVELVTHCSLDSVSMATRDVHSGDWNEDFCLLEVESMVDSWDTTTQQERRQSSSSTTTQASKSYSSSWEEISEVSSIQSFHSKTDLSFLEAARCNGRSWRSQEEPLPTIAESAPPSLKPTSKSRSQEQDDDDCDMFDSYFFWEGAKGGHGGNGQFRFGKENVRRYSRYHQRRKRSSARAYNYKWLQESQVHPKYMN